MPRKYKVRDFIYTLNFIMEVPARRSFHGCSNNGKRENSSGSKLKLARTRFLMSSLPRLMTSLLAQV